jgi:type II secretory pathway pseudopilin PulG
MIEIAICLAIIGIALVAIIGVLPMGLNVQKDNREETVINQDATVFMEAIRNGARGADDLTNYVFAIVNTGTNAFNYTNLLAGPMNYAAYSPPLPVNYLTTGARIVRLMSTPEYVDGNRRSIPNLSYANPSYSNYVVAYACSMSGPASEKPPQDNAIVRGGSFSYKIVCENVPVAIPTPPVWQSSITYTNGDQVLWNLMFWQSKTYPNVNNQPPSANWSLLPYGPMFSANLHELRLTFLWPLLPNGKTGGGRQTFRTTVAGQIVTNIDAGQTLYFFQSQSFNNVSAP